MDVRGIHVEKFALMALAFAILFSSHQGCSSSWIGRESKFLNMSAQYRPRYAYIDPSGRIVLDVSRFQAAGIFSGGMAAVQAANHAWGYVNRSGDLLIAPQFEQAKSFSEELAAVQMGGKWGFIDKAGRVVIEPRYEYVNSFSEGLAVVVKERSISQQTNTPRKNWSKMPGQVESRLRKVDLGVPLKNDSANPRPPTEVDVIDKYGHNVLSINTAELQPNIYENARFSEGLINVTHSATRKVGFLDKTGRFVIAPTFVEAAPFSEGLARVALRENGNEKLGFINREGKFVIPAQFNTDADFKNSHDFSEGLAGLTENLRPTVTEPERYAFIDRGGAIILLTNFFYAGPFRDGLASVYDAETDMWGYIDRSGKVVIPVELASAENFSEGLALVVTLH